MTGLFGIINLGLSALTAHRKALAVHSHNLANASAPGYSRQEAVLLANPPLPRAGAAEALVGGQYGTGVRVDTVRRVHESFLALQARTFHATQGRWSAGALPLREAESVLAPAPGQDLSALLDSLWDAWESVANRPEDMGLRAVLRENAAALASTLRESADRLHTIRASMDTGIRARVEEVNRLAGQIAEHNRQIQTAQAEGRAANDLLDARERLLDRLSGLCGALPLNSEGGHLIVYLDGRPLIQGGVAHSLTLSAGEAGVRITTSFDGRSVSVSSGEVGGLLHARDVLIPGYVEALDGIAATLIAEVNARHQGGFGLDGETGRDFFVAGGGAGDIALSPEVLADVRAIAAAGSDAPGDGSAARDIAKLRTAAVLAGGTLGQAAQALLGRIGDDLARHTHAAAAAEAALDQIEQQRQSVSGVSIDEELAYLTLSQRAYEAAARVVTAADEMLAVIIERMGAR